MNADTPRFHELVYTSRRDDWAILGLGNLALGEHGCALGSGIWEWHSDLGICLAQMARSEMHMANLGMMDGKTQTPLPNPKSRSHGGAHTTP